MENIILYCLKQLNGERTIYSIYHLLNGKKSSQTLQDAHLFSIKNFFRIMEPLTREAFEKMIKNLYDKQWIKRSGEQRFLPSELGEMMIAKNPLPHYINGWEYHQLTVLFWERLSMLVQVASNFAFHENSYIPIQKNRGVHSWLKSVLKEVRVPKNEMGKSLYLELVTCLDEAEDINPFVLVYRLTGYGQIGLTAQQAANEVKMEWFDYQLSFVNVLHYFIHKVNREGNRFPLLSLLFRDMQKNDSLTLSTRKTLELLDVGYNLKQIAQARNLKLSTIEDHLVELVLNVKDFPIENYVDKATQKKVIEISLQESTRQLKQIKNQLTTASYFQIRLVLAKYGDH